MRVKMIIAVTVAGAAAIAAAGAVTAVTKPELLSRRLTGLSEEEAPASGEAPGSIYPQRGSRHLPSLPGSHDH